MWTELPTSSIPSADEITTFEPSAIRHFYDKLLKLKDLMHTETARNIAIQRHDFMKQFINQFLMIGINNNAVEINVFWV